MVSRLMAAVLHRSRASLHTVLGPPTEGNEGINRSVDEKELGLPYRRWRCHGSQTENRGTRRTPRR